METEVFSHNNYKLIDNKIPFPDCCCLKRKMKTGIYKEPKGRVLRVIRIRETFLFYSTFLFFNILIQQPVTNVDRL